ncbi:MAG: HAD family hydrolase [SAR86 cluster bacterium]|uniref:HAD family hydrolase n=1 Tax=SAR86 cluster bacterium TaxID=2030880 RepID=A0A2A4XFP4_9GAMM|nr:MAG: HAD family hydrolase [SAR86 cluster bacterium]
MSYHSLIFDLDGTLTDPLTGIVRCMNYALSSHDHQPRSEQEIKPYIGPPLEIALSDLSGSKDEAHIKELIATYRERYGELGYAENVVYEGIYDLLDTLQEQGFRMGVCTSKFEKYAIKVLEKFELDKYFRFVSGSGAYGTAKSDQLQELLDTKIVLDSSLMIGDRYIDLTSAHKVGLRSAGVLWGYGSEDELAAEKPEFIAESPVQLGKAVIGNNK